MTAKKLALSAAIAIALSAMPVLAWDDKECEDWLKNHPGNPHPDCVQEATPTPRPRHDKTPTPVPQPTNTPQPEPTNTPQPEPTATPQLPTSTPVPSTPVATPTEPVARATPTVSQECIPCGEADASTPEPTASASALEAAPVQVAGVTTSRTETPVAPIETAVLSAITESRVPVALPMTGSPIPYVASLLAGIGLAVTGWFARRLS